MVHLPVTEENPENTGDNSGGSGSGSGSGSGNETTKYNVTFNNVTNPTNQKLGNVTITLTDKSDSTNVESGTTSNGEVTISVKAGTYAVTAERDGYTAPNDIPDVIVTDADVTVSDAIIMTSV